MIFVKNYSIQLYGSYITVTHSKATTRETLIRTCMLMNFPALEVKKLVFIGKTV